MVEEAQLPVAGKGPTRRKVGNKKGGKGRKERNMPQGKRERVKVDQKMKKLFRKRARDYNSDDDEEDDAVANPAPFARHAKAPSQNYREIENDKSFEEEDDDDDDDDEAIEGGQGAGAENEFSDGEDGEIQPGVTRFTEGCRAFRMAFKNVIKKAVSEDSIGPVLSAHKKLVAEKLAEEETERKVKGEAKKEKHLAGEKGHVKPANYLDAHEKFLIGVATKGVVKLFNAVNKAQNAQKGLNPLRSKDAKTLSKRRKEAFFSELGNTRSKAKAQTSSGGVEGDGPAWAPLRDNYMLTSSKLKDWDKMHDGNAEDDGERMSEASTSEDDD